VTALRTASATIFDKLHSRANDREVIRYASTCSRAGRHPVVALAGVRRSARRWRGEPYFDSVPYAIIILPSISPNHESASVSPERAIVIVPSGQLPPLVLAPSVMTSIKKA
jgi:hypothetical protein